MKTLLRIDSSLFSAGGASHALNDAFESAWRAAHPDGAVVTRDLAADPLPHLDAATFLAFRTPDDERTDAQRALVATSDALVAELQRADVVTIGLPMYNFGVPSTLKAWFDHVARAGVTFRYTAQGPVGLVTGKEVHVFATRGGAYAGTARDTETTYVRDFLGFIGMNDVDFVYAESLAGADKAASLAAALAQVDALAAPWRHAA